MKPQLYTNDFDTFQSNAYLYMRERIAFSKNMYVMVQINPHSEPLPRFQEGFQLCGIHQIYSVGPPILDPRLKQLVGELYNLSFPSGV